jgi:hypothetical protein
MTRSALLVLLLAFPAVCGAMPPPDLQLVSVASGFTRPVAVVHAGDGSGRLFIVEQEGVIFIQDGIQVLPTPFLDVSGLVVDLGNEQGLLGLAFHPDYAVNGFFYVNYTREPDPDPDPGLDRTVIARYTVSAGNANVADPASALTLLEIEQDFSNHNGGHIAFGPDGYLYIGMGDGGSGGDPLNRAQSLDSLLGKMLRIDVDGALPTSNADICGLGPAAGPPVYGIPADNPFAGADGVCDEIWALGVRNPWRWSFDGATGDLIIGDVGQNAIEEIDFQPASSSGGENYGWSCREGTNEPNYNACLPGPLVDPILEYPHTLGCSVTGGYRYRGQRVGGLGGTYVYGDYCSRRIFFATLGAGGWSTAQWQLAPASISSFGEDESGELYVVLFDGTVRRFASASTLFADGFEDGTTVAWAPGSALRWEPAHE